MDKFQEMQSFVAVVNAGSFVKAADTLGTSKAAVSRHVAELEQRIGARLLNRTTRKLSLTDDGEAFYHHCVEILESIDEAEAVLSARSGEASGRVRVSAPVTFGIAYLAPLWGKFLALHPRVTLDVSLSDRTVEPVEEGYDLVIRISQAPHPTLIGRQLASSRVVLCASRAYLQKHGEPLHPHELAGHDVISYSYWSSRDEWRFEGPHGPAQVTVRSRLTANNGDTCRAAALEHQGIILQPDFLVGEDLRSGRLVELMPDYRSAELGIYALYASRKQLPLKLRHLIDFLAEAFRQPVWRAPAGKTSARVHR
ncbi:LysR family transcriptional regulator [Noviherbaspirillum sedimenti]|uniref:LysR family transcriptional regulator n=1 Tax=Noviherbaspirillum sedimenti TaxID=2320865 RepID=A0A3A3G0H6_9BURK|nr:LysR family transcriptional regulator [Noviherbaspirillum sedimenti]RJG01958.1 LysR family transcriptional regulator [Noviherbaspirillum sedimenti]